MKSKIKAWLNQIESGQFKNDGARVLQYIKKNPYCTIREISDRLTIMYPTVSGRVSDAMDAGVVEECGHTETGRFTYLKFQSNPEKQLQNSKARKEEKIRQWINKGINSFADDLPESLKQELEFLSV